MTLFGLIKNKCFYCRIPIEKGSECIATVKVIGYTGTFKKKFCTKEHAEIYSHEIERLPKKTGGSCCH